MTILTFTLILLIGAYAAGLLGSLTGLGGGVVVIPLLTLAFGVDFHYAVGAALWLPSPRRAVRAVPM